MQTTNTIDVHDPTFDRMESQLSAALGDVPVSKPPEGEASWEGLLDRVRRLRLELETARRDDQASRRQAVAAAVMIVRLAQVSRHHHPHNLPNEIASWASDDARAFLARHNLDVGGRWIERAEDKS